MFWSNYTELPEGTIAGYCWLYKDKPFRLIKPAKLISNQCGCEKGWQLISAGTSTKATCIKSSSKKAVEI
ncbi:hypothetical protein H0A36_10655 [Endozoicomonas sp. SM1973]|uniref:Uncharacterized protein n=1 Tax=Spartinivicinus marinus TaxID=2994442 RepID=A0A853HXJ1_9GAMM|nr:hypothetical protein [Spartinivicinus marinus]MCX4024884.1 hypothetical protein [Spartinivicinus marinus]NYZ66470.1 hypothetical protein [Spartinivicinus marinus]